METSKKRVKVLVVDDSVENLELMSELLRARDYEVGLVSGGLEALTVSEADPPDIVLLDINMPEINGYETCRMFKQSEGLKAIPVIFISGLSDTQGIIKGFEAGGVDYVTKPFKIEEVDARIETHLKIKRLQDALRYQNEHLEELVEARTRELIEAHERLKQLDKVKSDFLRMISYEMRTPLNGVLGCSEVAFGLEPGSELCEEVREDYEHSKQRMLSLIDDALFINELEANSLGYREKRVSLLSVVERSLEGSKALGLVIDGGSEIEGLKGHEIRCNEGLMERALSTLFMLSGQLNEPGSSVGMEVAVKDLTVWMELEIASRDLTEEVCRSFFEVESMSRSRTKAESLSLRPVVAERILSLYSGKAWFQRSGERVKLMIELEIAKGERKRG